jgi:signal transduction histidine kinase
MEERTLRRLAVGVVAVLVVVGAVLSDGPPAVIALSAVAGLAATAVLSRGGRGLLPAALVAGAAVAVLGAGQPARVSWFAVCALAGYVALSGSARQAWAYAGAAVAVLLLEATVLSDEPGWAAWIGGTLFSVVICRMARRQQDLVAELRAAQADLADKVRAEERTRVARELHDVIAHSLTVSLLHVSSARLAVQHAPEEAADALAQAEALGRQSLAEVRSAVGLLREGHGGRAPLPGAAQLPALVDGFRRAGAQVAYDVVGDPERLTATTGLTVYRILQESLTNAVRHGSDGGAAVRLEVGDSAAVLTVDSPGAPGGAGPGAGLLGMQERAQALGGELTAGPAGDGWQVRTVLPA